MKISATLVVLALAVGVLVGRLTAPKHVDESTDVWRQKIQALTEKDIAEYYQLKTLEEKYKKADEILGKILMIFLADLGIRVSQDTLEQAQKSSTALFPVSSAARQDNSQPATNNATNAAPKEIVPIVEKPKVDKWVSAEKLKNEIRNEHDLPDFLEKVKIDNLTEALKSATSFKNKNENLEFLKGRFVGTAQVKIKDKNRDWAVDLNLNAEMEDGALKGFARIRMSENGKQFSNLRDRGNVRSYKEFSSGSEAIMIGAAPDTYFQIYYLKDLDMISGNVYEKLSNDDESFTHIGTLKLKRTN